MRILIVDDHAIVRKGLMELLRQEFSLVEFTEATSSEEAISMALNHEWDLILLDISLPGRNGIDTLKQLRADHSKVPILMISMQPEEQYAVRALKAGASGYVSKDSANEELIKAVNRVLNGKNYLSEKLTDELLQTIGDLERTSAVKLLSDRELEVMKMIAEGTTLTHIAESLSLSVSAISTYRLRILKKLLLKTNSDIVRYAMENGIL